MTWRLVSTKVWTDPESSCAEVALAGGRQARATEKNVAKKRRLGFRFWWEVLQFVASGLVVLAFVGLGIVFVFSEGLPWIGSGFADLGAGEASLAALVVLLIFAVSSIVLVGILVGFGAEIGRSFARRLSSERK